MDLKNIREKKGVKQVDLSLVSGVSQKHISDIETGKIKSPGLETLQKLAKALGVSIAELVSDN